VDRLSTDSDTFSATIGSFSGLSEGLIRLPQYARVRYVGTNLHFEISFNGWHYKTLATEAEATWLGGRAERIGIAALNANNTNGDMKAFFEWFRRTA
jgi:hypothetical protein